MHPETGRTVIRQVACFADETGSGSTFTDKMKRKIDSAMGRVIYGMRLVISEPPFAHITSTLKLDRFALRVRPRSTPVEPLLHCAQHMQEKSLRVGVCLMGDV